MASGLSGHKRCALEPDCQGLTHGIPTCYLCHLRQVTKPLCDHSPHSKDGGDHCIYYIELLCTLNELMHVKGLLSASHMALPNKY